MQGFHELSGEDLEEFDWFSGEKAENGMAMDYDGLVDLKNDAGELAWEEGQEDREDAQEFVCGEIEEDGLMWKYSENLTDAMDGVFSAVSEKLCGYGILGHSGLISEYVGQLGEKCEIVQSKLQRFGSLGKTEDARHTETSARIEACLLEHGCVIALVSDEEWRVLMGEEELPFVDSGVRALQVIGLKGGDIIVNDFANEQGSRLAVPRQDFAGLYGILMEVYK